MQRLQAFAGTQRYSCPLELLHEGDEQRRWLKPGCRKPDCGCCLRRKLPTFLYAMPFSDTRLFLEETSLVARPDVPFEELKQRLDARLAHYGIRIKCAITAIPPQSHTAFLAASCMELLPEDPQGLDGVFQSIGRS